MCNSGIQPMLILYAEDDIDDFGFFCEVAKGFSESITVINTRNGIETIEYLDNSIVLPELIFLDINMPAMDGKACLKNIKRDPKFRDIPVIIYSTSQNPRDRDQCIQMGAVAFLAKPNNVSEANSILSRFLDNRQLPA